MTTYVDRFIGWQAAVEARLVEYLSLEELDNHESFSRPEPFFQEGGGYVEAADAVAPEQGAWWNDAQDKGLLEPDLVGWEAVDARLDSQPRETRVRPSMKQWATDKVARTFFRVRTQADLDGAFALLGHTEERHHIAQSIIQMAVDRVVRLERKARQDYLNQLRELNREMARWAQSIGYRVRLSGEQNPVAQKPRDQAWVLVELRPGIGQVCRGRDTGSKKVVMAEPEIFAFAAARMA